MENKFSPTKAWRLRQRLDFHIGALDDAVRCLKLSRERKAFDKDNFDFSLKEIEKVLPRLVKFYNDHKWQKKREVRRCVQWGCDKAALIFLKVGESKQTNNGFLIAKIEGWYCPNCAGSYGK